MPTTLTITYPDDFHVHFRDDTALSTTVAATARCFKRALIMPNLNPALCSIDSVAAYRQRILSHIPSTTRFTPLMSLYLTDHTSIECIDQILNNQWLKAIKWYPQGATTNAHSGVSCIINLMPVLEKMSYYQIPLLIHGEVTDPDIDIFDREAVFIDTILEPLRRTLPELPIVLEHITTRHAVEYCRSQNGRFAATITVHHLLFNRNTMLVGGIRPHYYCLPILKRREHQEALRAAAISGDPRFFLGTDSAPHERHTKESSCGCAGVFSAPTALELYAQVFDQEHALDQLEAFASRYGADFYQLPYNNGTLTLHRENWTVPEHLPYLNGQIIPLAAGESLPWKICHA